MHNGFFIDVGSISIESKEVMPNTKTHAGSNQSNFANDRDCFTSKIIDADILAKTRKLLDSSIVYAWHKVPLKCKPPALTRIRWIWRLAGAYHSSRYTSRLMEQASQRFAASGRHSLAQWAAQKAKEEAGHDRLALLDIQSMGYDPLAVVQALVPSAAQSLVDSLTRSVQALNPIDCVGHAYASERLGTFQGEKYIQSVEALLPVNICATRWLRVHTAVGAEIKHVEEIVEVVAQLNERERHHVAEACYKTALLRFNPPKEGYISDEELQQILKTLELPAHMQAKFNYKLLTA
ncbi:hypothetical protein IQ274_27540 [Nostoc sp. LEGE 12447]|uniref:hypothetical protein n=1 Tax=Nostoc sp. LEGE 12447 TaxID=1828640 RepID=UPI001883CB33|nr:hypothetical protein [Nostoc sp. LEGE 12447]MBE9001856.1 hypothetical protein [Nostoc sp. LEGE 12447]